MSDKFKFISRDALSRQFSALVDNVRKRNANIPSSVFSSSQITECPRRLIYRVRGTAKDYEPMSYMKVQAQQSLHDRWLDFLSKSKGIAIIEKRYQAFDCNYNLRGDIDFVISAFDKNMVVQVHSVNSIPEEGASKKHVIEVMVNAWLMEVKDGLIIYENCTTQEITTLHVTLYKPIIESTKKVCTNLFRAQMEGRIPESPYLNQSGKECVSCEFKKTCEGEV